MGTVLVRRTQVRPRKGTEKHGWGDKETGGQGEVFRER